MEDFLLNIFLPAGLVLSLVALVHCAVSRRGTAWFLITILLGPLGGLFYFAGYWDLLPFKPPKALQVSPTASRRCPRCQQAAPVLHEFEDGRKLIQICQMCKSELELKRTDFSLPS